MFFVVFYQKRLIRYKKRSLYPHIPIIKLPMVNTGLSPIPIISHFNLNIIFKIGNFSYLHKKGGSYEPLKTGDDL